MPQLPADLAGRGARLAGARLILPAPALVRRSCRSCSRSAGLPGIQVVPAAPGRRGRCGRIGLTGAKARPLAPAKTAACTAPAAQPAQGGGRAAPLRPHPRSPQASGAPGEEVPWPGSLEGVGGQEALRLRGPLLQSCQGRLQDGRGHGAAGAAAG